MCLVTQVIHILAQAAFLITSILPGPYLALD